MHNREQEFELEPLYMVAMMQVHHEMHNVEARRFEPVISDSLKEFGIGRDEFEEYLEQNRDSLERAAELAGL